MMKPYMQVYRSTLIRSLCARRALCAAVAELCGVELEPTAHPYDLDAHVRALPYEIRTSAPVHDALRDATKQLLDAFSADLECYLNSWVGDGRIESWRVNYRALWRDARGQLDKEAALLRLWDKSGFTPLLNHNLTLSWYALGLEVNGEESDDDDDDDISNYLDEESRSMDRELGWALK
jgi:hypothetical protein